MDAQGASSAVPPRDRSVPSGLPLRPERISVLRPKRLLLGPPPPAKGRPSQPQTMGAGIVSAVCQKLLARLRGRLQPINGDARVLRDFAAVFTTEFSGHATERVTGAGWQRVLIERTFLASWFLDVRGLDPREVWERASPKEKAAVDGQLRPVLEADPAAFKAKHDVSFFDPQKWPFVDGLLSPPEQRVKFARLIDLMDAQSAAFAAHGFSAVEAARAVATLRSAG